MMVRIMRRAGRDGASPQTRAAGRAVRRPGLRARPGIFILSLAAVPCAADAVLAQQAPTTRASHCIAATASMSGDSSPTARHDSASRARFAAASVRCAGRMHTEMDAALSARDGTADDAFAGAMLAHHQGAIDMARQLLLYGRDPALRSLALGIIADQGAEIELLRHWSARRAANEISDSPGAAAAAAPPTRAGADAPLQLRAHGPIPVSPRDRVYTADQVSNTVSVIDPSADRLVGRIRLGNRRPDLLSPLYGGQINVHGLGVSPDGRTLAVISTGSNGVSLIETATNEVKGTVYVGRNPHEGFFTPDGRELWVTVRGENHVAVIDPVGMRVVQRIVTAPGPGMVVFRPDGKVAFVDHSFTPELDVVDVQSHRVIERIPVVSPFSPNLAVTADGAQLWLTHKDVGKVTVVNAQTFEVEGVIETGPVTNHVNFAGPGGGTRVGGAAAGEFAYVTIGGENAVKVYTRDRRLVTTIPIGAVPHGLWPSGDGSKVYVGLQQGDAVAVIDTRANRKVAEIPVGQSPQALVYVPNAVPSGAGTANLEPPGAGTPPRNVMLAPVDGGTARATVTIRSLGPVDGVDVTASGLAPATDYTLYVAGAEGEGEPWPLATLRTDSAGKAAIEAVAPTTVPRGAPAPSGAPARRLVLVRGAVPQGAPVLEGALTPAPGSPARSSSAAAPTPPS